MTEELKTVFDDELKQEEEVIEDKEKEVVDDNVGEDGDDLEQDKEEPTEDEPIEDEKEPEEGEPTQDSEEVDPTEPEPKVEDFDFTYKVQGEVKEFDERLKNIIKTKEDEAFVRDLLERADGIHHVKEHRDRLKSEVNDLKAVLDETNYKIEKSRALAKGGDPLGAIKELGFTEDDIIKAATVLVVDDDMEKQKYQQQSQMARQMVDTQFEQRRMQEQYQNLMLENAVTKIQTLMQLPEVSDVVSKYESIMGKNAFAKKIGEVGSLMEMQNKTMPSPEAVFNAVFEEAKTLVNNIPQPTVNMQATQQQTQTTVPQQTVVKKPKKANPNFKSSGAVGQKKIKTIWDDPDFY